MLCLVYFAVSPALPTSRREHLVLSSAECHKPMLCLVYFAVSPALPTSRREHLVLSSAECHKPMLCLVYFAVSPAISLKTILNRFVRQSLPLVENI